MARKISNLSASYTRLHDWLNFIHFLGYKYKIRLVSILRKREDQASISIFYHSKVFSSAGLQIKNHSYLTITDSSNTCFHKNTLCIEGIEGIVINV